MSDEFWFVCGGLFSQLFCGWICFIFGHVAYECDLNLKFQQICWCLWFENVLKLN